MYPSGHSFFYTKIRIFLILPGRSYAFLQRIRNFTVVLKQPFVFYSEMQNSENYTQKRLFVSHTEIRNLELYPDCHSFFDYNVPRLPFILWLQNTNFSKFFRNSNLLFDNKLKNLKLHPNCHLLSEHEIQNLKSYSNGHSFFY